MKIQLESMKEDEKVDSINRKKHKEKILKDIEIYKNECISEVKVVTKKYLTVDYIESKTGYDFLSNVSSTTQTTIEAKTDTGPTS